MDPWKWEMGNRREGSLRTVIWNDDGDYGEESLVEG